MLMLNLIITPFKSVIEKYAEKINHALIQLFSATELSGQIVGWSDIAGNIAATHAFIARPDKAGLPDLHVNLTSLLHKL